MSYLITNILTESGVLEYSSVSFYDSNVAIVAQLVRAPDCDSGGRGFEPHRSPFFCPVIGHYLSFFLALFLLRMYSDILLAWFKRFDGSGLSSLRFSEGKCKDAGLTLERK